MKKTSKEAKMLEIFCAFRQGPLQSIYESSLIYKQLPNGNFEIYKNRDGLNKGVLTPIEFYKLKQEIIA
jgi:hypothetical protein